MAISFDAGTHKTAATGTSLTYAHTVGVGSNRILWVGVQDGDSASDTITGVTYNSVSMTRVPSGFVGANNNSAYGYILVNPDSGTNNVVISCSASHSLRSACASYAGASQTGQPDSSTNSSGGPTTTPQLSITTVADNSWALGFIAGGDAISAAAGTTLRGSGAGSAHQFADKNGATSPAGGTTLDFTQATSQEFNAVFGSISPAGAAAATTPNRGLGLMGVGQ